MRNGDRSQHTQPEPNTTHEAVHQTEIRNIILNVKNTECDECGKEFTDMPTFNKHIKMHADTTTEESDDDKQHMTSHTEEKPFDCLFESVGHGDMLKHLRNHKETEAKEPMNCDSCGLMLGNSIEYVNHMESHTGKKTFECTECGAQINQAETFIQHLTTHRGKKTSSMLYMSRSLCQYICNKISPGTT